MPQSNSKYGTRLAKSATGPLHRCIIEELRRPLLFMILLTQIHSLEPSHGWKNCNEGEIKMLSSPWLVNWFLSRDPSRNAQYTLSFCDILALLAPSCRLEIKLILRHVARLILTRPMNMQKRMEFCTWKHQRKMPTMLRRFSSKSPRACQRQHSNRTGRHFLSFRKSRNQEVVAECVRFVNFECFLF